MFHKVMIANRGEIAVRIAKTVQEMGIKSVAVYSEPDKTAPHVLIADEAFPLQGVTSKETYLDIEKLITIAKQAEVDAIHPGYGFLSENAEFAKACQKAGITFIGPSPDVIHQMGDKIIAKAVMQKAGVPVVPGWVGDTSNFSAIEDAAKAIGYPVLVKAAAGGGGKGMRIVQHAAELQAALESAAREAQNAFGDSRIFLEKYIENPRHIEFQIFGDAFGNVVHLFERECSIQRRHQKIIEESPSPIVSNKLRKVMGATAVKAAEAIGYTNAGTVEFIVAPDESFYFLEVNTRLQVEHPVTEMITQQDLVKAQLLVAMGEPLPFSQESLKQTGHAIECRIYAEDPASGFLPATGKLHVYKEPTGPGIRVDSGVTEESEVSVYYDPMLAKLIVWGQDRETAIQKITWALSHFPVLGVTTNIDFLKQVIRHPDFKAGQINTHFLDTHLSTFTPLVPDETVQSLLALVLQNLPTVSKTTSQSVSTSDPWLSAGSWKIGGSNVS